jgi:hypothetical protein
VYDQRILTSRWEHVFSDPTIPSLRLVITEYLLDTPLICRTGMRVGLSWSMQKGMLLDIYDQEKEDCSQSP